VCVCVDRRTLTGQRHTRTDKAPVTKTVLGVVGASTLLASVLDWKPWLPLQLDRVLADGQVRAPHAVSAAWR
jgi:hypothetical protein